MIKKIIGICLCIITLLSFTYSESNKDMSIDTSYAAEQDTRKINLKPIEDNMKILDMDRGQALALSKNGDLFTIRGNEKPVKVLTNVKTASFNRGFNIKAIKKNGELWIWGDNKYGQLGDGTTIDRKEPFKLADHVKATVPNQGGTAYITENGELWACGFNARGKLGVGHCDPVLKPVKILEHVKTACLWNGLSYAILENDDLFTWGDNHGFLGEAILGNGSTDPCYTPKKILDGVKSVSTDGSNVFILKTNNELWGYGSNSNYQIEDGNNTPVYAPKKIMDDVEKVYTDVDFNNFVLKKNGELWDLVGNPSKKVLDDVKELYLTPEEFHYAIKKNGELWAWGVRLNEMECTYINNDAKTENNPVKIFDHVKDICSLYTFTQAEKHHLYILTENNEVFVGADRTLWDEKKAGSKAPVKIMSDIKKFPSSDQDYNIYIIDNQGIIWGVKNDCGDV
ncbi:RCC1 domain-containing protein [Crassaminicella indica]|uniref:Alpha-tubulin suppressor n=1 Tax=Crassaminicella indica TaxID=2855394 RepID=A0ABX8R9P6_9CLOT|nr:hypothetical protein [Crassaminicella indica]QXM05184.1 hypothetical protein KVH43_07200 [Crassaminicella indica]